MTGSGPFRVCAAYVLLLKEGCEEALRQVLGLVVRVAAAAYKRVHGRPIQLAQAGERLPGFTALSASGRNDKSPAGRRKAELSAQLPSTPFEGAYHRSAFDTATFN
jgi:hypothetical protein